MDGDHSSGRHAGLTAWQSEGPPEQPTVGRTGGNGTADLRIPRRTLLSAVLLTLAVTAAAPAHSAPPPEPTVVLEFETGAIWQSRNQIHIPDNAQGTRFAMTDLQGSGPIAQRRVELTWNMTHHHQLRFVYAPLSFSGTGTFAEPVRFAGGTFPGGAAVDSDYKFDSYRLTYRYLLHESDRWQWRIGVTAFVRDARVELRRQGVVASDSDVGLVPLLSANVEYRFAPRWAAVVDFDGLVGTQGRAIDAAFKVRYDVSEAWYVTAGYRTFEGGVDNSDRFAFAWYNFAVVSLGVRF
jgi:hypothetical protein